MVRPVAVVVRSSVVAWLACAGLQSVHAAEPPDSKSLIAAEQRAMQLLSGFDGVWRGPATTTTADGRQITFVQTERFGPLLDRSLRLVEGRGYGDDGTLVFNAFGV